MTTSVAPLPVAVSPGSVVDFGAGLKVIQPNISGIDAVPLLDGQSAGILQVACGNSLWPPEHQRVFSRPALPSGAPSRAPIPSRARSGCMSVLYQPPLGRAQSRIAMSRRCTACLPLTLTTPPAQAVNSFTIKQRVRWGEALTQGCIEQSNVYDIYDATNGARVPLHPLPPPGAHPSS